MPAAVWTAGSGIAAVATAPAPASVTAVWRAAAGVIVLGRRLATATALPSRIVTGMPTVFADGRVKYRRGTYGLLPDDWGVIEEVDVSDGANEFERRDDDLVPYAAGVQGTVYRFSAAVRMPSTRPMPAKGDQFPFIVRGQTLTFTVFSAKERWEMEGLRMVDVTARHYTDFPDAVPAAPEAMIPQTFASSSFLSS